MGQAIKMWRLLIGCSLRIRKIADRGNVVEAPTADRHINNINRVKLLYSSWFEVATGFSFI